MIRCIFCALLYFLSFDNVFHFTYLEFALFKSNLLLYSLYYGKACSEFEGVISASSRPCNIASFGEMLQRLRAVGNTVSGLASSRFEPRRFEPTLQSPETNLLPLDHPFAMCHYFSFRQLESSLPI